MSSPVDPVGPGVTVESEDSPLVALFGERDERGICQVHRLVGVFCHQRGAVFERGPCQARDANTFTEQQCP